MMQMDPEIISRTDEAHNQMMPFKHLIDEVLAMAAINAGLVALAMPEISLVGRLCVYAICVTLIGIAFVGGSCYKRNKEVSQSFFIWSLSTLLFAGFLSASMSYFQLDFLDSSAWAMFITVLFWSIPIVAFAWLAFVKRIERTPGVVNTSIIGHAGIVGALSGGITLWIAKDHFIATVGFLLLTTVGSLSLGLAMFHMRRLIEQNAACLQK